MIFLSMDSPTIRLALLVALQGAAVIRFLLTGRDPLLAVAMLGQMLTLSWPLMAGPFSPYPLGLRPESHAALGALLGATVVTYAVYGLLRPRRRALTRVHVLPAGPWALCLVTAGLAALTLVNELPSAGERPLRFLQAAGFLWLFTCRAPGAPRVLAACRLVGWLLPLVFLINEGSLHWGAHVAVVALLAFLFDPRPSRLLGPAVFCALLACLQAVKADYRDQANRLPDGTRLGAVTDLLRSLTLEEAVDGARARLADPSLERALALTPRRIPFAGGRTYRHVPAIVVPRFLWPGKPQVELWNAFGRRYGFLRPRDRWTSIQFNYLAEGYLNFGYPGLWGAAAGFGVLLAALARLLRGSPPSLFVAVALARPLFFSHEAFTLLSEVYLTLLLLAAARALSAAKAWLPIRFPRPLRV